MNNENYLKVLEEAIEKIKELRVIYRHGLFLQIGNATYRWSFVALEFYYKNNVKIIDWSPFYQDLNLIKMLGLLWRNRLQVKLF